MCCCVRIQRKIKLLCYLIIDQKTREWTPLEDRKCTDIPWLLLFALFNIGMVSNVHAYVYVYKAAFILKVRLYIRS